MLLKAYKIHLISAVSAVGISCLYNFVFLFNLYELFQTTSFIQFATDENIKFIHALAWIFSVFVVVYCVILFNYSWKESFIRKNLKGWNKQFVNITTNIFLYLLLSLLAYILFRSLPHNVEVYSIVFFLEKFILAEISALIIASLLIANRTAKRNKEVMVQLQIENKKAELQGLKEQISPHFFFNTLNSLSAVIRTAEKSDSLEFVEKLSQVYRYILDSGDNNTVSIKEEIGFLNDYSYLLHKRFGNNFSIDNKIDSKILENKMPPLALHVLFENVTKHNKLLSSSPVKISILNTDDYIYFKNELRKKENVASHGSGLSNLNKRYQMICGKEIEISEKNNEFCVKIPIIK